MLVLELETPIAAPPAPCFNLARSIDFHQQSLKNSGERAVAGRREGLIELGEWVSWEARYLGWWFHLHSQISALEYPHYFTDEYRPEPRPRPVYRSRFILPAPLRYFRHEHRFIPTSGGTLMRDYFLLEPIGGWAGQVFAGWLYKRVFRRLLESRNQALKQQLEAEAPFK